jgi:hypothetical protein
MTVQLSQVLAFNPATIDEAVTRRMPGVYALGHASIDNKFVIDRIGRSDTDLAARLKSDEYKGRFTWFQAAYVGNADAAYHAECELYHSYGGKLNPNHPARPAGKFHRCNHCPIFN